MFEFLYNQGKFYGVRVSQDCYDIAFYRAPVLWSASQSLLQAIKIGPPARPWTDQLRPLKTEVNALLNAVSSNDVLAKLIIDTIPAEAKERGLFPEDALKQRFNEMEGLAMRLDLVPASGAPFLVHILSYLQSLLLIKSACRIPMAELRDEKIDLGKLSTEDIFYRARFWLERGDLAQALKYVNLLKGAPRIVAKEWMREVKMWLETEQAAKVLMAHATSSTFRFL